MSAIIIMDWIERTQEAEEALRQWRANLQAWMTHPNVPDEAFMSAIQDMSEAGLLEWLDGYDVDALRLAVTGVDARYTNLVDKQQPEEHEFYWDHDDSEDDPPSFPWGVFDPDEIYGTP